MTKPLPNRAALVAIVCERIAQGESLSKICERKGMPSKATFITWAHVDPEIGKLYKFAQVTRAHVLAEEILDIADEGKRDTIKVDGRTVVDHEAIARSRLRVDARKWYLSKVLPKVYGDRLALAGDEDAPLTVTVRRLAAPKG